MSICVSKVKEAKTVHSKAAEALTRIVVHVNHSKLVNKDNLRPQLARQESTEKFATLAHSGIVIITVKLLKHVVRSWTKISSHPTPMQCQFLILHQAMIQYGKIK